RRLSCALTGIFSEQTKSGEMKPPTAAGTVARTVAQDFSPAIAVKRGCRPAIRRSVIAVAQGFSPVLLALIALFAYALTQVLAQAPDAVRIRAAFLEMIDRPRVALDPESRP